MAIFKVDIVTGANLDAAKDTSKELEHIGEEGKKAHEEVQDAAHKSELSHHELKEAVRAVSQQFGGLANVGLWLNPVTAGLAATLFLVDKLKDHFGELTAAAIEAAKAMREIREDHLINVADAARGAVAAVKDLERASSHLSANQPGGHRRRGKRRQVSGCLAVPDASPGHGGGEKPD